LQRKKALTKGWGLFKAQKKRSLGEKFAPNREKENRGWFPRELPRKNATRRVNVIKKSRTRGEDYFIKHVLLNSGGGKEKTRGGNLIVVGLDACLVLL